MEGTHEGAIRGGRRVDAVRRKKIKERTGEEGNGYWAWDSSQRTKG